MKRIVSLCLIVLLLGGCGTASNEQQPNTQSPSVKQIKSTSTTVSPETARLARLTAEQDRRVDAATAVAIKDQLSVAVKVSNFNRLRLQDIRRTIHENLSEQFPSHTIHVTTDRKLFNDLQKLHREVRKSAPVKSSEANKFEKKLKTINENMKG